MKSVLRRAFVQGDKIDIFARWFEMKKSLIRTFLYFQFYAKIK